MPYEIIKWIITNLLHPFITLSHFVTMQSFKDTLKQLIKSKLEYIGMLLTNDAPCDIIKLEWAVLQTMMDQLMPQDSNSGLVQVVDITDVDVEAIDAEITRGREGPTARSGQLELLEPMIRQMDYLHLPDEWIAADAQANADAQVNTDEESTVTSDTSNDVATDDDCDSYGDLPTTILPILTRVPLGISTSFIMTPTLYEIQYLIHAIDSSCKIIIQPKETDRITCFNYEHYGSTLTTDSLDKITKAIHATMVDVAYWEEDHDEFSSIKCDREAVIFNVEIESHRFIRLIFDKLLTMIVSK